MKISRWNLAIPMTSSNAFPKRNGCSRRREPWIQDRQRHGNATRRILTGGARQARAHLGRNSRNSCDALSRNRQNTQENHCPNFSGRILWESFLLAKLGACRSRRTVTKGDVKNIKTPKIGFLALAAWLVCFHPQFVKAGGEPLPVELSAGENEPPESELGLGKFSPLPFPLSPSLPEDLMTTSTPHLPGTSSPLGLPMPAPIWPTPSEALAP